MKIAHARERHGPVGSPFRLFAAAGPDASSWLDLEVARRRAASTDATLAHNTLLFRRPVTTLDDHLARGLRVETLADIIERFHRRDDDDDAVVDAADLTFGPPILRPASLRDFYAFEQH